MGIEQSSDDPLLARLYRDLEQAARRLTAKDEEVAAVDQNLSTTTDNLIKLTQGRMRERLLAERAQIEEEIRQTKEGLDRDRQGRVLRALQYLYHPLHRDAFREERGRQVSAFVIGGSPAAELWWSVHFSLKRLRTFQMQAAVRRVVFRPAQTQANDAEGLWSGLRFAYLPRPASADPEVVAPFVAAELQRQAVVIVVDTLPAPWSADDDLFIDLDALFNDFWPRLVSLVQAKQPPPRYRLLLFVLYEQTAGWSFPVADQLVAERQPTLPRRLPVVTRLSEENLQAWLDDTDAIPEELVAILDQGVADAITASGDGVPDKVMTYLCEKSQTQLDEGARQWTLR